MAQGNACMDIHVLLIAADEEVREKYKAVIQSLGVNVTAVPSFKNQEKTVVEKRYHGLLVDLQTKFKAVKDDKEFIRNIMGKFPVAHLNIIKSTQEIRILYQGSRQNASIEDFLTQECSKFTPRRFRYHPRKPIHFNLILSSDIGFIKGHHQRTATIDVSRGGCFIFSTGQWRESDDVWFIIKELKDNSPVHGRVRHYVAWGTDLKLPGIGVEFLDIDDGQNEQICHAFDL